jgi:hypothetical protein
MSGAEPAPFLMTREEQLRRAHELLNDPLLQQAFLEITESATMTWRTTDNPVQREQQWFLIRAIFELQRVLEGVLTDAKVLERRDRRIRGMRG